MSHSRLFSLALPLLFGLLAVPAEASLIDSQWGAISIPQPPSSHAPFISLNYAVYDRGTDGGTDWTGNADINNLVSQWSGTAGRYLYLFTVGRGSGFLAPDMNSFTIYQVDDVATFGTVSGVTAFTKNGYGFIMSTQAQGQFAPLTVEPSTANFAHNKNLQTTTASWTPPTPGVYGSFTGTFSGGLGPEKTQSQFFGYTSNTEPTTGPVPGPVPVVPEPATLALFGLGMALSCAYPFRRRPSAA